MPTTSFARMNRSDHSVRPPTPAATLAHGSPNACNNCHTDQKPGWADKYVREWFGEDSQEERLRAPALVAAARKQDWSRLNDMLAYIQQADRDVVFATSLIRLMERTYDGRKWAVLERLATEDSSPLVRSAAATALRSNLTPSVVEALVKACGDDYRLVRIRAADALAPVRDLELTAGQRQAVDKANRELLTSLSGRQDQWQSHYNLGNYWFDRGDMTQAIESFERAQELRPDILLPWVNAAMAHARLRNAKAAEAALRQALTIDPKNATANLNLGLLLADKGELSDAIKHLRAATDAEPQLAAAHFNLGLLLIDQERDDGLSHLERAARLQPDNVRYVYTLAYHQYGAGHTDQAKRALEDLLTRQPHAAEAALLLARFHEDAGEFARGAAVLRNALKQKDLPPAARQQLDVALRKLEQQ
jgi:tetratricopeptide (TPR) repeat protein